MHNNDNKNHHFDTNLKGSANTRVYTVCDIILPGSTNIQQDICCILIVVARYILFTSFLCVYTGIHIIQFNFN